MTINLSNIARRRGRLRNSFRWLMLWCATGTVLVYPQLTVTAAHAMGIGRGADLVFYCNVLATLVGFFAIYIRQRKIDHQLTVMVRELAIINAVGPGAAGSAASLSTGEASG
jgi:hypothetical protein